MVEAAGFRGLTLAAGSWAFTAEGFSQKTSAIRSFNHLLMTIFRDQCKFYLVIITQRLYMG